MCAISFLNVLCTVLAHCLNLATNDPYAFLYKVGKDDNENNESRTDSLPSCEICNGLVLLSKSPLLDLESCSVQVIEVKPWRGLVNGSKGNPQLTSMATV